MTMRSAVENDGANLLSVEDETETSSRVGENGRGFYTNALRS